MEEGWDGGGWMKVPTYQKKNKVKIKTREKVRAMGDRREHTLTDGIIGGNPARFQVWLAPW